MMHAPFLLAAAITALGVGPTPEDLRMEPINGRWYRVEPAREVTLRWSRPAKPTPAPLRFVIRDYEGVEEASGTITPAGDGSLALSRPFARGYHEVEFPSLKRHFGLIAAPAFAGKADPFFAIDAGLTWLTPEDRVRGALIAEARDCGIALIRERLRWAAIEPEKGRPSWDRDGRADALRRSYCRAGLPILELAHDAPEWAGRWGVYPFDLAATAESWREIGKHWGPAWGGVELWNEPDIQFGGDWPADQYAAFGKAASYGLHAAGVEAPVVAGVIANYSPDFMETLAANGLVERAEAFSFHDYGPALDLEAKAARFRDWLRTAGRPDMPLWLTECGWPWTRGTERASAEEDRKSAAEIAAKAIEARACGVARHFPFVLPFYEENAKNFGMTDRQGSPMRSLAAYAQAIRALAGLEYLGDLKLEEPGLGRARVFGDGSTAVVTLYATKSNVLVKLPGVTISRVEGADGRALKTGDDESFTIPDGLAFAWVDRGTFGDRLDARTRAMSLKPMKAESRGKSSPIVLRPHLDPAEALPFPSGYRVKDASRNSAEWAVEVFNLGERPESIDLTLELDGAKTEEPTRRIQSPPHSKAVATWPINLTGSFAGFRPVRASLKAEGASGLLDRAEFRVAGEPTLEAALAGLNHPTRLPIEDLARWSPKISAGGVVTFEPLPPGGCRLNIAKHPAPDRWAYPEFRLPDGVPLRNARGLVLRARCEKPAQVRAFLWEGDTGVGYLTQSPIIPADGAWHVARVAFDRLALSSANAPDPNDRLDLDSVRRISLGMNHEQESNALEISDLYVEWPGDSLQALWEDLEKDDTEASRALLTLSTRPADAVAFLDEHLKPLKLDAVHLKAYLMRLASPNEVLARKAFEDLEYFDPRLAMDLPSLMEKTTETPARQRLVEVLSGRDRGSLMEKKVELRKYNDYYNFFADNGSWWAEKDLSKVNTMRWGLEKRKWTRAVRAIALLEHIGTPEARALLKDLASGHPDAQPTRAAAEALRRLEEKGR
ncbi:hypothetical protein OJF2_14940 [Aquisphaera giovannonii]|uniref:Uncharacterized protein n=1 Tax=Aquisphaera giovannonii TaxID=406548 RepID=A0A5B9VXK1_9BACT|nr:hypothetical protein [Aquisphaera giovannonii]QEH33002.1 hypothetical protein OJF2_14940 [Aquisphaera giovannonii]